MLDRERVTNVFLWLLTIGTDSAARADAATAALVRAGGSVAGVQLPSDPARTELDSALDGAGDRRVVVHADVPDLARVLRRLMRRGRLADAETAVLPTAPVPFLSRHGIAADLPAAARIAVTGGCRTVGVLKDDSGNLVVDHAELRPWSGERVWVRAYVDDDCLCDGEVAALTVERGPAAGLRATVHGRRMRRARSLRGRGLTLACADAAISSDGADRDQPRRKRIWWDEPDQWCLAVRNPER